MKAKVYKMTIMVIDFEGMGEESVRREIESAKYTTPSVLECSAREVEWSDEHPLNQKSTFKAAFAELFVEPAPQPQEQ